MEKVKKLLRTIFSTAPNFQSVVLENRIKGINSDIYMRYIFVYIFIMLSLVNILRDENNFCEIDESIAL